MRKQNNTYTVQYIDGVPFYSFNLTPRPKR
jgi:hypothetical protein